MCDSLLVDQGGGSPRNCLPAQIAALSVLAPRCILDRPVPIGRLLFVVRYEEGDSFLPRRTRLAGYGARRVPWGVLCGGANQCRFDKNANLKPKPHARHWRIDSRHRHVLRTLRRMQRLIAERIEHPCDPISDQFMLPPFLAGFSPDVATQIEGDGPELNGAVHETGRSAAELMADHRRELSGQVLYPLAWVSHLWEQFRSVFADLRGFPRDQVFAVQQPDRDLRRFRAACEFDFVSSRFRGPDQNGW